MQVAKSDTPGCCCIPRRHTLAHGGCYFISSKSIMGLYETFDGKRFSVHILRGARCLFFLDLLTLPFMRTTALYTLSPGHLKEAFSCASAVQNSISNHLIFSGCTAQLTPASTQLAHSNTSQFISHQSPFNSSSAGVISN